MKRTFILFSILFTFSLQGQQLLDLYLPVIPQKLLNKVEDRQLVEKNLEFYSDIHPELIGYYILHLKTRYEARITDTEKNYLELLKVKRDEYINAKNRWANYQISNLEGKNGSRFLSDHAFSEFNIMIQTNSLRPGDIFEIPFDKNYIDFIEGIFLSENYKPYDREVSYYNLNRDIFVDMVVELESLQLKQAGMTKSQKSDALKRMRENWYLVGKKAFNKQKMNTSFEAADICFEIYKSVNEMKPGFYISLSYDGILSGSSAVEEGLLYTINFERLDEKQYTPFLPVDFYFVPQFSLSAGYRFRLRSFLSTFSFIETGIKVTYLEQKLNDPDERQTYFGNYEEYSPGEFGRNYFIKDGSSSTNDFLFSLNAVTPLFYFTKWFSIEGGVLAGYHTSSLTFQFKKEVLDYYKSIDDAEILHTETVKIENEVSKFSVAPFGRLSFDTSLGLYIDLNISGYYGKYIPSIDLKYGFWAL